MPELPEVETVRRELIPWLEGHRISQVEVLHPRAVNPRSLAPITSLKGARISEISRRGKFLIFSTNRELTLIGHLGMSGQMLIAPKRSEREKHTRAIFKFGNQREELRFIDQRTFGWLSLEQYPACIAHIALDIFDKDFSPQLTIEKLLRSKTEIKRALLNQRLISGIGNIYADEALWQSKIHPETQISQLNELDMKKILREVKRVMSRALAAGGSSIDQLYRRVNGESGYFDISLRAYGRQGLPCSRCATPIKRIAFTNRSSHFCPHCQKKRVPPAGAKV